MKKKELFFSGVLIKFEEDSSATTIILVISRAIITIGVFQVSSFS